MKPDFQFSARSAIENVMMGLSYISNKDIKNKAEIALEKVGLKGFKKNEVGVHISQPLVLVNYGNASGKDILDLAHFVKNKIKKEFDIVLEFEVNII